MYNHRANFIEATRHVRLYSVGNPRFDSKRNRWSVNYIDPVSTKRRHARFKSEARAWAFCQRAEDDREALRVGAVTIEQLQVGARAMTPIVEVLDEYIADMKRQNFSTKHQKEARRLLNDVCHTGKWEAPKHIDQAGLLLWLHGKKPTTANIYARYIRAFTKWLDANHYLPADPLKHFKPARETEHDCPARALSTEEFKRLINCDDVPLWRRVWYHIGGRCGLRHKEIERLKWGDIDFKEKTITVIRRKGPRSTGTADMVGVPSALLAILETLRQAPAAKVFKHKPHRLVWKNDLKRAGIPFKTAAGYAYLRSLRKTLCTHLALDGVDVRTAQKAMRHRDSRQTTNIYTDPALLDAMGAVENLDRINNGDTQQDAAG